MSFVPKLHGFYLGILSIHSAPYVVITVPSQDYTTRSPQKVPGTLCLQLSEGTLQNPRLIPFQQM